MSNATRKPQWNRLSISTVEDLSDAVHGAGLCALQISRAPLTGSLAFGTFDDVIYNTGYLGGHVSLKGSLSDSMVTLGLGVVIAPGTRHWLKEIKTGDVGIFMQGDDHDALYMPGSLYATATLNPDRLEDIAANVGVVLNARILSGTGLANCPLSGPMLNALQSEFRNLHAGLGGRDWKSSPAALGKSLLYTLIDQLGHASQISRINRQRQARVVALARTFIHENLDRPLSIDVIAAAASTSHRTLHRAFVTLLNETPYSYVQKARLHRIRHELVSDAELRCTITSIANRWGATELGRFAAAYRELFGELPSQTLARR